MASLGVCALLRTKTDQCVQTSQARLLLRAKTGGSQTSVQLPRCLQIAVLLITFLNFKNTLPKNAFFFYLKKKKQDCVLILVWPLKKVLFSEAIIVAFSKMDCPPS